MIGFDPRAWILAVIGLAVGLGVVRLLLWQKAAPVGARSSRPRMALLLGLQPAIGLLLYLTLFPPSGTVPTGVLVVATAGTRLPVARAPEDILVALPEAGAVPGAIRVPDLATALRRFPGAQVRVVGQGLVPRDQTASPHSLAFDPPPSPRGLIDLALPEPVAPGAAFSVGGQLGTLPLGVIELVDPADVVVDRARLTAGQRFVVEAGARTPGLALFGLRLRDPAGKVIEEVAVPVQTRAQAQPRVRVLAGAPGPETKYLRRWASDAGIDLGIDIDVGAGVQLGDGPIPLTRAALGEVDLVVIDDRRWETLGAGGQAALTSAVSDGLGLLLRPTGPLSATTRRDWAGLGLPLTGSDDSVPARLDPPVSVETEADPSQERPRQPPPELARRGLVDPGTGAVSLLRDADGVALASWRLRGRGRVGVWTVTDSYALLLTGQGDRYADLWSDLFSVIARAGDDSAVAIDGPALTGRRTRVCRIEGDAVVFAPDGSRRSLPLDPLTGAHACGAYWPTQAGWHLVRDRQGRETIFHVQPAAGAPSLTRWADRQATLALVTPASVAAGDAAQVGTPGSSWPWAGGLVGLLGLLWWTERRRPRRTDGLDQTKEAL